jgi:crotonobetainyl-CoA:carnitine CoA-transferase CaiB-like acyl-CoA transferase
MGAIMLCQGVLAALVARFVQGVGQKVDASHLSANMWLQGMGMSMSLIMGGNRFGAYDRKSAWNVLANLYKCKDERWIQLMHLQPDRYWESFMTALGLSKIVDDPKYATMDARSENREELVGIMDKQFLTRTSDEWDKHFRATGDFIYAKVQSTDELVDDPQVIANEYITTFDHPVIGPIKMCNHPNIYSETPSGIFKEAPELGQHTEEILVEELGYSWDDITALQDKGVIL